MKSDSLSSTLAAKARQIARPLRKREFHSFAYRFVEMMQELPSRNVSTEMIAPKELQEWRIRLRKTSRLTHCAGKTAVRIIAHFIERMRNVHKTASFAIFVVRMYIAQVIQIDPVIGLIGLVQNES